MAPATIQIIRKLEPIPSADRLELAHVLGWQVVVKKGEFREGQPCVFVEPDSVLPEGPEWSEFLRSERFRVKPVRLRGTLSQGLALPLTVLQGTSLYPEVLFRGEEFGFAPGFLSKDPLNGAYHDQKLLQPGLDVSDELGVCHYARPESGGVTGGRSIGPFPPGLTRTDEPNLQSVPWMLASLRGGPFQVTVKLDGCSGTFARVDRPFGPYTPGQLLVCTRNRSIARPEHSRNAFWRVADRYCLAERLPLGWAVRGEVVGPHIQGNCLKLSEPDLYIFDVTELVTGRNLDAPERRKFCAEYGLEEAVELCAGYADGHPSATVAEPSVPVLEFAEALARGDFDQAAGLAVQMARGNYFDPYDVAAPELGPREGIVIRPWVETRVQSPQGQDFRLSFKVLNPEYLEQE